MSSDNAQKNMFMSDEILPAVGIDNQAPNVQKLDRAIQWINHYPVDEYLGNQLR